MTFHNVRFPIDISLNSAGGPTRRTEIVTLASGHEARNGPWAGSRRRFNAGYGVKSMFDIQQVIAFFEARRGRLHSFLWRDPFDWKSCAIEETPQVKDQIIGVGDGIRNNFQLTKTYESGGHEYQRNITKPIISSILLAIDDEEVPLSGYSVENHHGTIVFNEPPNDEAIITAGFLFDIPVRFDTDELSISLAAFNAGDIPNMPVIEVFS